MSGGVFTRSLGGKGANQAAAAARLGATVTFVGCIGDDDLGALARHGLERCGVDCRWLRTHEGVATGTALINVDGDGDNTITVASGANRFLDTAQIKTAIATTDADVLITGFEIGAASATVALRTGRSRMIETICNPSPVDGSTAEFVDCSTVVVNEVEAAAYGGPAAILAAGAGTVVVTLGAAGVRRFGTPGPERVDGFAVKAIDTTGAGDAFCAALAVSGDLRFACAAGALACRAVGARASQPTRDEVDALIREPPRSPRR